MTKLAETKGKVLNSKENTQDIQVFIRLALFGQPPKVIGDDEGDHAMSRLVCCNG